MAALLVLGEAAIAMELDMRLRKDGPHRGRRRVSVRSALLLTLAATFCVTLIRLLLAFAGGKGLWSGVTLLAEGAATLLIFGGGAWLGLCVIDGDHRQLLRLRVLSTPHIFYLCLLGVLAVCPVTLLADMARSLFERENPSQMAPITMAVGGQAALFLPQLLKNALLTPVCEELFYRGYLFGALEGQGRSRAILVSSVCFALAHVSGGPEAFFLYALFGALMCLLYVRTGSVLAPMIAHACYNLSLLLLAYSGMSALFDGLTLVSCVVRLLGCMAFYAVLWRVYASRASRAPAHPLEGIRLNRREMLSIVAAAVALVAAAVISGVMHP